jgi:hypothetical protein
LLRKASLAYYDEPVNGEQIGTIVGIVFGCAWGIAAGSAFSAGWRTPAIAASLAISAVLIARTLRLPQTPDGSFNGRIYGIAVSFEMVVILVATIFLNRTGNQTLIPPVVTIVVGLHFTGLWRASDRAVFLWLAAALCAVGCVAAALPEPRRLPATALGSAVALWSAAAATLFK